MPTRARNDIFLVVGFLLLICVIAYVVRRYLWARPLEGFEGFEGFQDVSQMMKVRGGRQLAIEGDTQLVGQKSLYSELIRGLEEGERYLVNLCPLTASLGGYIGSAEPGAFYSEIYIQHALRAGIRSFVLPISTYLDDNKYPPNWPLSGDPAIVCRDLKGKIISLNGLSVKKFCSDLMTYMTENSAQANEPIILYIHETEEYVPDKIGQEEKYVKFMSKIARELDVIPVERRLTTLGGYGSGVGSANESVILTQIPLSNLKGKFIIMTNFDTKPALKPVYKNITPSLDNYVNFTVKPVVAANAGLNVNTANSSRSLRLADVKTTKINWSDQARTVWHMTTLDNPLATPPADTTDLAVKSGIQMIPVPFFMTNKVDELKPIWDTWKGYAWRLKVPAARYLKPAPVVPQPAKAQMNARVDSSLQPGQVAFK
jgi:hypothetical protein